MTLTRAQPLSVSNVSALQAAQSGGGFADSRSPRSEASLSSAYTWQDWGSLAASLPSISAPSASRPVSQNVAPASPVQVTGPVPTPDPGYAPPLAPAPSSDPTAPAPPYVAEIAKYNPNVKYWYVVIVGRRVGVFAKP